VVEGSIAFGSFTFSIPTRRCSQAKMCGLVVSKTGRVRPDAFSALLHVFAIDGDFFDYLSGESSSRSAASLAVNMPGMQSLPFYSWYHTYLTMIS
jgi:hypothetical protein